MKPGRDRVNWDWLVPAAVLTAWVALSRWIFPAMGVPT
jgi:hypothetical protein